MLIIVRHSGLSEENISMGTRLLGWAIVWSCMVAGISASLEDVAFFEMCLRKYLLCWYY